METRSSVVTSAVCPWGTPGADARVAWSPGLSAPPVRVCAAAPSVSSSPRTPSAPPHQSAAKARAARAGTPSAP